ncbi:hypothetical protein C0991_009366, partial [Blastosporella zonata]
DTEGFEEMVDKALAQPVLENPTTVDNVQPSPAPERLKPKVVTAVVKANDSLHIPSWKKTNTKTSCWPRPWTNSRMLFRFQKPMLMHFRNFPFTKELPQNLPTIAILSSHDPFLITLLPPL